MKVRMKARMKVKMKVKIATTRIRVMYRMHILKGYSFVGRRFKLGEFSRHDSCS